MNYIAMVVLWLFTTAQAASLSADLSLTPKNGVLTAELRLEQAMSNQLLVWIWRPGKENWLKRSSQPVEPSIENGKTIYRFNTPINQDGMWYMRTTIGAGQAGFIGFSQFYATPQSNTQIAVSLQNNFAETVPGYVQPVGYAVYALVALFALGLTTIVFRRLEQRPS